jgi:hypothetical protein
MIRDEFDKLFGDIEFRSDTQLRKETGNIQGGLTRKAQYQTDKGIKRKQAASQRRRNLNEEKYGTGTYVVRSPGNDLLDFYDQEMKKLDPTSNAASPIPPSVVYHYRFEHEYPEFKRGANRPGRNSYLREKLKDYYYTDDNSYYATVYTIRYKWLVDTASVVKTFKFNKDAENYMKQQLGQNSFVFTGVTENNSKMFWRGKAQGWSITWHSDT